MISVEKFSDDEEKENKFDSQSSSSIEDINSHLSLKNIESKYIQNPLSNNSILLILATKHFLILSRS